jgi:hypothetical protein
MQFRKISGFVFVWVFLIPLFASAIPRSIASPGLTDRNVQVWTNEVLENPKCIDISADGRYIAAASYYYDYAVVLIDENNVTVWRFSVADAFHPEPQHVDDISWISISDDGGYVAFGGTYGNGTSELGYVFLFNQQGQIWNKTGFYFGDMWWSRQQGEFSGDGTRLALNYVRTSEAGNNTVEVYDTGKSSGTPGQFMWRFEPGSAIDAISMSFHGDYVAIGGEYIAYLVQAPAAGVHEGILVWQKGDAYVWEEFWPIRISGDGKYVFTANRDSPSHPNVGSFLYYNQTGSLLFNYTTNWPSNPGAFDIDLSADGQYAVGVQNSTIFFFDKTGLKWTYDTNSPTWLSNVRISADGNFLIARPQQNEVDIWHLNKFGKLIWHIPSFGGMGPVAISANGEYFCSAGFQTAIYKFFSKKYFSYRFVTVDPAPLPISNLNVSWYFGNGTLYSSALTNSTGWTTFFDPHFVDYSTIAYYWGTKVGEYTPLVTSSQYELTADHTASLYDWTINIHDVNGNPVTARVETYLWNSTLYDNRTASSIRFEDLPNQTYTFKVYYPPGILSGQQTIALSQEEQSSTIVIDTQAPSISSVKNTPLSPMPTDTVKISANVTDDLSGVHNVTLSYRLNATLQWTNASMTYNSTSKLYEANITPQSKDTNVTYLITAYDNTGKQGVNDNSANYFKYQVIPEFGALAIVLIFIFGTVSLLLIKHKKIRRPAACSDHPSHLKQGLRL